jgi:hypothetical protein
MGINMSHNAAAAGANGGPGRDSPANRRRNDRHATPQSQAQSQFGGQQNMSFSDFDDFRSLNPNAFMSQYHQGPFNQAPGMQFGQDPGLPGDPFQYGMYGNQYPAMLNPAAPNFNLGNGAPPSGRAGLGSRGLNSRGGNGDGMSPGGEEWMGRFQGLSLGSQ